MADANVIPRLTVSLSGADEVGSTTLLSLFPRDWPLTLTGGIDRYSEDVRRMLLDRTWFGADSDTCLGEGACDDKTFVLNLARACHQRLAAFGDTIDGCSDKLQVMGKPTATPGLALDRSGQMFKAVCIARIMTLRGLALPDAAAKVESILRAAHASFPTETIAILIQVEGTQSERAAFTLGHCGKTSQTYSAYQHALQQVLDYQVAQRLYTAVIIKSVTEPFIETLHKVTACLQRCTEKTYQWRPLLANIQLAVAYGGLSECGKSTMCIATVKHNGDSAFRVKISYLCDLVLARLGRNIYELPANERAIEMVHELDLFVRWHRWLKVVTLDSLHNFDFTCRLAELIGNLPPGSSSRASLASEASSPLNPVPFSKNVKLLVVYIDTPLNLRISRTEATGALFDHSKDVVKMARGAHMIERIADLVVKNDGTFQEMFDTVWTVAKGYLQSRP